MDALLKQSLRVCPFLKKTSPTTLRALSTSTSVVSGAPGGGKMSNLQVLARRCPVMSKALAVQSVRIRAAASPRIAAQNFGFGSTCGGPAATAGQRRGYVVPSTPAKLHATGKAEAQADTIENVHLKAGVYDTSKGE